MKIVLSTLALLILSGCCSWVFAADDFGPRFGASAPYALQNNMQRAQNDVKDFDPADLNDIMPAAGGEESSGQAESPAPQNVDAGSDEAASEAPSADTTEEAVQ